MIQSEHISHMGGSTTNSPAFEGEVMVILFWMFGYGLGNQSIQPMVHLQTCWGIYLVGRINIL